MQAITSANDPKGPSVVRRQCMFLKTDKIGGEICLDGPPPI